MRNVTGAQIRQRLGWLILTAVLTVQTAFQSQAEVDIYLAGTPDGWPFEYYDGMTSEYQGVLPELLRQAGANAGIPVYYINPSDIDNRLALAANKQVDAVCTWGITDEELDAAGLEKGLQLAVYTVEGQELSIGLAYTESMSPEVRESLEAEISKLDLTMVHGAYLKRVDEQHQEQIAIIRYRFAIGAMLVTAVLVTILLVLWTKRKRRQLELAIFGDEITGHDNFAAWKQKYDRWIVTENCSHYAVCYVNTGLEPLRQFYGYEETKHILSLASDTCKTLIDVKTETFARFNEYDFIFLIQYSSREALEMRTAEMTETIGAAFGNAGKHYLPELYTGIYCLSNVDTMEQALRGSEIAAEYAQLYYLGQVIYDIAIEEAAVSGYAKEHEAVDGLKNKEFIMYLQPLVEMRTESIVIAEALVRWNNPKRGFMHPRDFLDAVKKKRLIGELNMEIFRQGCRFLGELAGQGHFQRLMFNFTIENIGDNQFVSQLLKIAGKYQVKPEQIIIQMNQIVEISTSPNFKENISTLREHGIDICLDGLELDLVFRDYVACGVNMVKIRPELIRQLDTPEGRKIMENITGLLHELGLKIVCMGIETAQQKVLLKEFECEIGGGFYYFYPVGQEVYMDLLNREYLG